MDVRDGYEQWYCDQRVINLVWVEFVMPGRIRDFCLLCLCGANVCVTWRILAALESVFGFVEYCALIHTLFTPSPLNKSKDISQMEAQDFPEDLVAEGRSDVKSRQLVVLLVDPTYVLLCRWRSVLGESWQAPTKKGKARRSQRWNLVTHLCSYFALLPKVVAYTGLFLAKVMM